MDFARRLHRPSHRMVFALPGDYVWDGSLIRDTDRTYHLFASRWPAQYGMRGWLTDSRVIRAEGPTADGPFEFRQELDVLHTQSWSRHMAHNPRIHHIGGRYCLFYIGTHWGDSDPGAARDGDAAQWSAIRFNQRIGLATAPTPRGPWTPCPHNPILQPRPGEWDAMITVNPSVRVETDGSILMVYKSTRGAGAPLILGAAHATRPEGPYARVGPSPLFEDNVEDPCFWHENGRNWMLVKDMTGAVCGVRHGGALYTSDDDLTWTPADPVLAYDLELDWVDGPRETATFVERPFVYVEDDRPCCLLNAILTGQGPSGVLVRRIRGETSG